MAGRELWLFFLPGERTGRGEREGEARAARPSLASRRRERPESRHAWGEQAHTGTPTAHGSRQLTRTTWLRRGPCVCRGRASGGRGVERERDRERSGGLGCRCVSVRFSLSLARSVGRTPRRAWPPGVSIAALTTDRRGGPKRARGRADAQTREHRKRTVARARLFFFFFFWVVLLCLSGARFQGER